jgi:hypothetical protein
MNIYLLKDFLLSNMTQKQYANKIGWSVDKLSVKIHRGAIRLLKISKTHPLENLSCRTPDIKKNKDAWLILINAFEKSNYETGKIQKQNMITDELNRIEQSIERMKSIGLINSPVVIYFKTPDGETMQQLIKSEIIFSDYSYNKNEYDFAIKEMESLGINTESQTFEQCVNSLIYMLKAEIKNVQPPNDMQCGVGKNNI